jgi:FlaA1/EpsC-like NDP-sugar epimerase
MKVLSANRNTPRWIIFLIDVGFCVLSLLLAYLLRFNFSIPLRYYETFVYVFPIVIGVRAVTFILFRTYSGIVRYTSTNDARRIFTVITLGTLLLVGFNLIDYFFLLGQFVIPSSVIVIDYLATTVALVGFRLSVKVIYFELKAGGQDRARVIIYGAGEAGVITKRTLDRDMQSQYDVVAFIDDNRKKVGKKIEGIPILHTDEIERLLKKQSIDRVIISIQSLPKIKKERIVETCLPFNTRVLHVPAVSSWINGELSAGQITEVRIEDLLGREPIRLGDEALNSQLQGKIVLVTGAAGSIGSELARQVCKYLPEKIILLDQNESGLFDVENEIAAAYGHSAGEVVVADITNENRMRHVFEHFKPQVVYHAAAYKHVPMMEQNPSEAILTNVLGTRILVDLSAANAVETFVMISTDKAVNPTNVMGASKRIAEIYAQASNRTGNTRYITTRFGNVLGSNGSVIPRFKKQIENGGPVTVTHPNITRYFMTIPEACQLVLEAGAMGKGGEIYIFDMGEPIRIIDLAYKMIRLSGLEPGKDIDVTISGLRPGEKLFEELLNDKENTTATHHPQIMIARVPQYNLEDIYPKIEELCRTPSGRDNFELVMLMKELVPEYKSQNSVYARLDRP